MNTSREPFLDQAPHPRIGDTINSVGEEPRGCLASFVTSLKIATPLWTIGWRSSR